MTHIQFESKVCGFFTIEKFKVDEGGLEVPGTRARPVPTFKNLITNGGLDRMGDNGDWLNACQVGTGTAAPAFTDSTLANFRAGTITKQSNTTAVQSAAPYYVRRTIVYRFAVGTASGNLSEVGIAWTETTGNLFSRARIVDGAGNPTTITVAADEALDVTYEFRYYPKTADDTGTIVLGGITHAWTFRAATVTSADSFTGWSINPTGMSQGQGQTGGLQSRAWPGPIGPITGVPSGTALSSQPRTVSAYQPGSLTRQWTLNAGLSDANVPDGVGAFSFKIGIGHYQIGFSPKILKTDTKLLSITFAHSWGRL